MDITAILLTEFGGPDVLRATTTRIAPPGPGEILLRHSAVGVNFHDCYVRSGLYRTLPLPGIPGIEGVGVIEALGPDVHELKIGDRMAWVSGRYGGYASHRLMPATEAIRIPDGHDDAALAASLMKALTVSILVSRAHRVEAGQTVLIHAAAGGVGQLLVSWCKHLGARVIGTVGSEAKADIARACGADEIILYRRDDVASRVRDLTAGAGVDAAFDAVGRDTFAGSLASLGFEGTLVNYGQASGPVAPVAPSDLATRSLTLVRPIIFHYLRTPERLAAQSAQVFDAFAKGIIKPVPVRELPLRDAAEAHRILEAQQSPGGVVLRP